MLLSLQTPIIIILLFYGTMTVLCDLPTANKDVTLDFNSTLEEAQLKFYCRRGLTPNYVNIAYCTIDKTWIPDPTGLTCSDPGNLPSPTGMILLSLAFTRNELASLAHSFYTCLKHQLMHLLYCTPQLYRG